MSRDVGEGEVVGEVVLEPAEEGLQGAALRGGHMVVDDELRLPALPFQRHHGQPRRIGGDGGPVVLTDHVEAEVHAGGRSGRGEDLAVVDVQDGGVDLDVRVGGGQEVGRDPVRGGPQPVQEPRGRQRERARADRRDARAVLGGGPQRVTDGRGERSEGFAVPGTMTVSAPFSPSSPQGARRLKEPASVSCRSAQTRTWYPGRPSGRRVRVKTSIGVDRSNGITWSRARTATVCMA